LQLAELSASLESGSTLTPPHVVTFTSPVPVLPRKAGKQAQVVWTNMHGLPPTEKPSDEYVNVEAIQQNNRVIYLWYAPKFTCHPVNSLPCSRIIVTSIAGCVAGLLGQTGLMGFVWYLVSSVLVSLLLFFKLKGFQTKPYFTSWATIWTEGFGQGLMVNVLVLIFTDHFLLTSSLSCYFGRILSFIRFAV